MCPLSACCRFGGRVSEVRRKPIQLPKAAQALVDMRLHMLKCAACKHGVSGMMPESICNEGRYLVLVAAKEFIGIAKLHKTAMDNPGNVIYPCPDRRKHGPGYVESATPYIAHEIQEGLF